MGREGSVGIATLYGLNVPGIESRFSAPVQTDPGAHQAPVQWASGVSRGIKRPGRGVNHPPPSTAEFIERFLIIKPTRCTSFSNLFWNETLHVSDSSTVHHQEFFTVHTAMVYVMQVC
jgi:hypothetical protein